MAEKNKNAGLWFVALYPEKTKKSLRNNGNLQLDGILQLKSKHL